MSRKVGTFVGYFNAMSVEEVEEHYDKTTGPYRDDDKMFNRRQNHRGVPERQEDSFTAQMMELFLKGGTEGERD